MKTPRLLFTAMSVFCIFDSYSQTFVGKEAEEKIQDARWIEYSENVNRPTFVEFKYSPSNFRLAVANPVEMMKEVLSLKSSDNLVSYKQEHDELGFTHTRYQQYYKNIPVQGGEYLAHQKGGLLDCINGAFFSIPEISVTPSLVEAAALTNALAAVGAKKYKWQDEAELKVLREAFEDPNFNFDPKGTLVIYPKNGEFTDKADFRLAYKFNIFAAEPESRADIYIDAKTGELIGREELIHTADTPGKAVTKYSGTQDIVTDMVSSSSYRLRETGRGNGIQTMNAKTSSSVGGAVDFTDTDNNWNNVNAQWDEAATDAHWATEMTWDYYMKVHNRNSVDGNGFKLINYVHVQKNWFNASWNGQYMSYGDGPASAGKPLTAIDIGGHEMTHGVTSNSSKLVYQNESGALNESFSDIFGNMVEYYAKPTVASWDMGEAIGAIRNMKDPGLFNDPDTYKGTNWATGTTDNGGVHTNSGVQNKWFYILSIGEKGTNDLNKAYDVTGITREKAAKIAFRNLTFYLTSSSNYASARLNALKAAKDIYGECSAEYIATGDAWYAVGVGEKITGCALAPVANFNSDKTTSCDGVIVFTDKSTNAPTTWEWDFGDGQKATTQNPTHTYAANGKYTVKLIAKNATGQDEETKDAYIVVSKPLPLSNITAERCGAGKVSLTIANPAGDVIWYTAQTGGTSVYTGATYSPDVTANTTYYVEVSANGCKTDRASAIVTVNPPVEKPTISEANKILTAPSGTGYTYQWFFNGDLITGETKQTLALAGNGNYTVQISNGKCSATSDAFSFILGVNATDLEKNISIYPNPANGIIFIDASVFGNKEINIQLYSVIGKLMYAETYSNTTQAHQVNLNSMLSEGIYFLKLQFGNEQLTKKITLNK